MGMNRAYLIRFIAPLVGVGIAAAIIFTRPSNNGDSSSRFSTIIPLIIVSLVFVALAFFQIYRARRRQAMLAQAAANASYASPQIAIVAQPTTSPYAPAPTPAPAAYPMAPVPAAYPAYPQYQPGYQAYPAYQAGTSTEPQPPQPHSPYKPVPVAMPVATVATVYADDPMAPASNMPPAVATLFSAMSAATTENDLVNAMHSYNGGPASEHFVALSKVAQDVRSARPHLWTPLVAQTYGSLVQTFRGPPIAML